MSAASTILSRSRSVSAGRGPWTSGIAGPSKVIGGARRQRLDRASARSPPRRLKTGDPCRARTFEWPAWPTMRCILRCMASEVPIVWVLGAGFSQPLGGPMLADLLSLESREDILESHEVV